MLSPGCSKLDLSALIKALIAFFFFFLMSEVIPVQSIWMLFSTGGEKKLPQATPGYFLSLQTITVQYHN